MRVNWILPSVTKTLMNSTQNMNQLNTDQCMLTGYHQAQQKLSGTLVKIWTSSKLTRVDESAKELTRVDGKTRARVWTFITSYQPSSPFFSENNYQDWFLFNQDILHTKGSGILNILLTFSWYGFRLVCICVIAKPSINSCNSFVTWPLIFTFDWCFALRRLVSIWWNSNPIVKWCPAFKQKTITNPWSNKEESWETEVCTRFFSTLVP